MVSANSWTVKAEVTEGQTCVHAHISPDLDITKLTFSLLDEERKLIMHMPVPANREIYFCMMIGEPMFAQLGDCTKYVDGSGAEHYEKLNL